MGFMFRSEEMAMVQLYVQSDAAYFILAELGELGIVQFRDVNEGLNPGYREFVNEVSRCNEVERKLRFIEEIIVKEKIPTPALHALPKAPHPKKIAEIEHQIEKAEDNIIAITENAIELKRNSLQLTEYRLVLEKVLSCFNDRNDLFMNLAMKNKTGGEEQRHLECVTGVIDSAKFSAFERTLWRICRGNVFIRHVRLTNTLEDPVTGHATSKTVFVVFCQGEVLSDMVHRICVGYNATLYPYPSSMQERTNMMNRVDVQLADLQIVLSQSAEHRRRVLTNVAKEVHKWRVMVCKMKAIYHILNFFKVDWGKKGLIGECWVAKNDIQKVKEALFRGMYVSESTTLPIHNIIKTDEVPPTYNKSNKFTTGFQNLIDSYGLASYCEVNPALYTIVTFPFLFAMMFGDVGHALIMLAFAACLVIMEKKLEPKTRGNEIFRIFFGGRYIILLMGIFSLYTGSVYNDFFSKSINIFGTSWKATLISEIAVNTTELAMDPRFHYKGTPYVFGMDPIWQVAKNKIIFLNSFKMKLSIIFGVTHMIFGVCVSIINFVYFRKYSNIFLVFIPQLFLLLFLFMWMVVMMFLKWMWYSCDKSQPVQYGSSCAPSVLIYFINMILFKKVEAKAGCNTYMFKLQGMIQKNIIYISALCIPTLLLGKPLYIKFKRSKRRNVDAEQHPLNETKEEEPMSEVFIQSTIHTIEYVLSTISHTASYLRLWALSLAHSQLSEVLWGRVFSMALQQNMKFVGGFVIYGAFSAWAFFTIAILVVMEGLSAFLHTLRLHWVEFMSKFYSGEGYLFQPFDFNLILKSDDD